MKSTSEKILEALAMALIAASVVLLCSVVWAEDYQLSVFNKNDTIKICAKDKAVCELAIEAIKKGRWKVPTDPSTEYLCESHPMCFLESSNHIKGYN